MSSTSSTPCNGTWLYPVNSPNGPLLVNYKDEIIAQWTSNCPAPQLLVWGPSSDESRQVLLNQTVVPSNGTYNYTIPSSVYADFHTFPFALHFELGYNSTSDYKGIDGDVFSVTSTAAAPSIYALSTTYLIPTTTPSITPASATTSQTAESATTTSSPTSSPIPNLAAQSSSGLSTGAKAGIGVGVALGVLLILGIGICMFILSQRRKKRNAAGHQAEDGAGKEQRQLQGGGGIGQSQELLGSPYTDEKDMQRLYEKSANEVAAAELDDGQGRPMELPVLDVRHELDATGEITSLGSGNRAMESQGLLTQYHHGYGQGRTTSSAEPFSETRL